MESHLDSAGKQLALAEARQRAVRDALWVIGEIRAYFAYDEARDAELTGFPYRDRRSLIE